jgi:hypothetical protein
VRTFRLESIGLCASLTGVTSHNLTPHEKERQRERPTAKGFKDLDRNLWQSGISLLRKVSHVLCARNSKLYDAEGDVAENIEYGVDGWARHVPV